jgi:hypothetical protein
LKPLLAQLTHVEVEFCIEEWSTGIFIKNPSFDEAENLPRYMVHLEKLVEWCSLNPKVVDKILQKKYNRMQCIHLYLLLI